MRAIAIISSPETITSDKSTTFSRGVSQLIFPMKRKLNLSS